VNHYNATTSPHQQHQQQKEKEQLVSIRVQPLPALTTGSKKQQQQQEMQVVHLSDTPRLLVIENALDPETCKQMMDLARPKLVRSRVASGA
jgi:hypothetical protein